MESMEPPVIREVAPGIIVAMAEDQMCGTWVLYNQGLCFIVEMPPNLPRLICRKAGGIFIFGRGIPRK